MHVFSPRGTSNNQGLYVTFWRDQGEAWRNCADLLQGCSYFSFTSAMTSHGTRVVSLRNPLEGDDAEDLAEEDGDKYNEPMIEQKIDNQYSSSGTSNSSAHTSSIYSGGKCSYYLYISIHVCVLEISVSICF